MSIECLYPTLIGNSRFNPSERTLKKEMRTLRASQLGVARLEFSSVTSIQQIGDDISENQPIHILIQGRDTTMAKGFKLVVLCIDSNGSIKVVDPSAHNFADFISASSAETTTTFVDEAYDLNSERQVQTHLLTSGDK